MKDAQRKLMEKKMAIGSFMMEQNNVDLKQIKIERKNTTSGNIFKFFTSNNSSPLKVLSEICIKKA